MGYLIIESTIELFGKYKLGGLPRKIKIRHHPLCIILVVVDFLNRSVDIVRDNKDKI